MLRLVILWASGLAVGAVTTSRYGTTSMAYNAGFKTAMSAAPVFPLLYDAADPARLNAHWPMVWGLEADNMDGTTIWEGTASVEQSVTWQYTCDAAASGQSIRILAHASNPGDDSFFVRFNGGKVFDWHVLNGGPKTWQTVTQGASMDTQTVNTISPGYNTVTIHPREDRARIYAIEVPEGCQVVDYSDGKFDQLERTPLGDDGVAFVSMPGGHPWVYSFKSQALASAACQSFGMVLASKADVEGTQKCAWGYMRDGVGFWMGEEAAGCGVQGWNFRDQAYTMANNWYSGGGAYCVPKGQAVGTFDAETGRFVQQSRGVHWAASVSWAKKADAGVNINSGGEEGLTLAECKQKCTDGTWDGCVGFSRLVPAADDAPGACWWISNRANMVYDDSNANEDYYWFEEDALTAECAPGSPGGCTAEDIPLPGYYSAGRVVRVMGGKVVSRTDQINSCPTGMKIFSPRTPEDYTLLAANDVLTHMMANSHIHRIMVDVSQAADNAGGGTGHAMNSRNANQMMWQTSDGSPWYFGEQAYSEPNGNYHSRGFLGLYGWADPANTVEFDDNHRNFAGGNYLCQPIDGNVCGTGAQKRECVSQRVNLAGPYSPGALVQVQHGVSTGKPSQANSCPAGWKVWSPRTKEDYDTARASHPDFSTAKQLVDVTKDSTGNSDSGGQAYAMNSEVAQQSAWHTSDNTPWYLRDAPYSEPSGNYGAGCYLVTWLSGTPFGFDDWNCPFFDHYFCQPSLSTDSPTSAPTAAPTAAPTTAEFAANVAMVSALGGTPHQTGRQGDTVYKCNTDIGLCVSSTAADRAAWLFVPGTPEPTDEPMGNHHEHVTSDGTFSVHLMGTTFVANGVNGDEFEFPWECGCA